jgi:ParB/RepB/Spo0J family partition protein
MKSYYMRVALKDIRLNPTNPRRARTPEMVDQKAASLKANGQLSPLKLRPTTAEERLNDPTTYLVLGGELRYLAAQKLGWTEVDALVLSVSPEEADLVALMDNNGQDLHWLDWYQAIEKWVLTHPDMTQEEVAGQLEVQQQVISKTLKVLNLLSPSARDLIYKNFVNSEAKYKPSESTIVRLSDMGSLKKPLNELQEIMDKALRVVIDHEMIEAGAKSLVHWIKAGNNPESYGQKAQANPALDANDPNAGLWKDLPTDVVKIKWTPKGYVIRFVAAQSEGPALVYGALANLEHLKGQAQEPENTLYRDSLKQVVEDAARPGLKNGPGKPRKRKTDWPRKKPRKP